MHITAEDKKEYLISEVLILGGEAYEAYRDRLKSMTPDPSVKRSPAENHHFLLTVSEDHEDGVIVDLSERAYEGIPAFASDAKEQLENHIRRLAELLCPGRNEAY